MFRPIYANKLAAAQAKERSQKASTADFRDAMQSQESSPARRKVNYPKRIAMPDAAKVSMKHAQRIAQYAPDILRSAQRHKVPVALICGVMIQESGVNPKAKSHAGASGLMQLMPATAKRMGVTDIWNPQQNIEGGTKYLGYLLNYYQGDVQKAVAAYNAGEGNVDKYGGIPPFKETQGYVPRVLAYARTVDGILGKQQPAMRPVIRNTMPRHAIANLYDTVRGGRDAEIGNTLSNDSIARRLARI